MPSSAWAAGLAAQANAEPVAPPLPTPVPGETPAPGTARHGSPGERASRCAGAATDRGTAGAGDREPPVRAGEQSGAVGLPQGCLASGPGPVRIHRYAAWPDARSGPTPAGSRSGAAAAARIRIADRPGVQRASANGVIRGRAASAGGVLPVERATATRVLRRACRARPGCATAARAGSADALAQRRDHLALEQLDAGAVVGGLGEVEDRVLAAEFAHPLELLDDLFRCAAGGFG